MEKNGGINVTWLSQSRGEEVKAALLLVKEADSVIRLHQVLVIQSCTNYLAFQ